LLSFVITHCRLRVSSLASSSLRLPHVYYSYIHHNHGSQRIKLHRDEGRLRSNRGALPDGILQCTRLPAIPLRELSRVSTYHIQGYASHAYLHTILYHTNTHAQEILPRPPHRIRTQMPQRRRMGAPKSQKRPKHHPIRPQTQRLQPRLTMRRPLLQDLHRHRPRTRRPLSPL